MEGTIKSLAPVNCPHCKQDFMIKFETQVPTVCNSLTPELITKAKDALKHLVMNEGFPKDYLDGVMDWINAKTSIFGEEEVDELFQGIKQDAEKI